jgi:hypothetical protein
MMRNKPIREIVFVDHILRMPDLEDFIHNACVFRCYDKGDDMMCYTALDHVFKDCYENIKLSMIEPIYEIDIYGYEGSFFQIESLDSLLTTPSKCICVKELITNIEYIWNAEKLPDEN